MATTPPLKCKFDIRPAGVHNKCVQNNDWELLIYDRNMGPAFSATSSRGRRAFLFEVFDSQNGPRDCQTEASLASCPTRNRLVFGKHSAN